MTLTEWLSGQGFPHGMECVGIERLQQLWDAAQTERRDSDAEIVKLARAYVDAAASSASWEEIGRITIELREALK